MKIAVRYAITAAILGEMIAANRGMGFLIEANAGEFKTAGVFAAVSVVVGMVMVLTGLLEYVERLQKQLLVNTTRQSAYDVAEVYH